MKGTDGVPAWLQDINDLPWGIMLLIIGIVVLLAGIIHMHDGYFPTKLWKKKTEPWRFLCLLKPTP